MSSHNLSNEKGVLFNPEVGTSYKYEIDEIKEIEQAIGSNENKVKLIVNSKIGLVYKILKKMNNRYEVLVQFDSCVISSHTGDVDEKDLASHQKNIEAFKGATFNFNLLADGRVENIKGFKEFNEKFAILNTANTKPDNTFNNMSDSSFKEEYFKNVFEKISTILPGKLVSINSSWVRKDSLEIGELQSLNVQCTLDSISTGIAYIKTTSPIEQTIAALNHSVKMKGEEDGTIEIDVETGMPITSSQKSIITGSLKICEVDVAMNINRRSIITGKKLKRT